MPDLPQCGTAAAYRLHISMGQRPCGTCHAANNHRARSNPNQRARIRAFGELSRRHREEYAYLLNEERAELGLTRRGVPQPPSQDRPTGQARAELANRAARRAQARLAKLHAEEFAALKQEHVQQIRAEQEGMAGG